MIESPSYRALVVVFALTVATIVAAWGFQVIGGYIPCALCYRQRWPYYIVAILALLLMLVIRSTGNGAWLRWGLLVLAGVMIVSAGLGIHHAGVEWTWWAGPAECSGGGGFANPDSVLPDLTRGRVVSCTEAQWRLFGISFAGYNALISAVIALVALWGFLKAGSDKA
ncbi:disulfide bond formation protein DsbB [Rhodoligotrophos appendicifer]|uniref:disulfide bond formation protein B n=1 Tax=Rhodoligotrophos appendicifer TaxID=987056 RepID=UPI0011850463|nr:disulfide bond formation protein B [Rhodoligotrophos appendicifer]